MTENVTGVVTAVGTGVGKDGYDCDAEFDERTAKALVARAREAGPDDRLFVRDAVEVLSFVTGDYLAAAPVLAKLRRYRILDLGCGYGRLAPLLSAFDCAEYLGVDRVEARLEYARARYASPVCSFELAGALGVGQPQMNTDEHRCSAVPDQCSSVFICGSSRFDVVWTSNVLQHLLLEDKLRLVATMKLARAPGGIILMREAEIVDGSREDAERRYMSSDHARHMVPVPFDELAAAFAPLELRRLGGIVYVASEVHQDHSALRASPASPIRG